MLQGLSPEPRTAIILQDHHVTGPMMIERIEWMRKHRKSFNMDEEDAA